MTNTQYRTCVEFNDCSICPNGEKIRDDEGNFVGSYRCICDKEDDE